MRLLPKAEFDRAKAAESKREIDEGIKLARRIDNLREVAAAEETSLETFRRETVAKLHEEIIKKSEVRDTLKKEVSDLEYRRKEALKPLDEEWAKVRTTKSNLDEEGKEIIRRQESVKGIEDALSQRQARIAELTRDAEIIHAASNTRLQNAQDDHEAAKLALVTAQRVESDIRKVADTTSFALAHRESLVAERENHATIKEKGLAAEKKRLSELSLQLSDREQMLERDLLRLKKHG